MALVCVGAITCSSSGQAGWLKDRLQDLKSVAKELIPLTVSPIPVTVDIATRIARSPQTALPEFLKEKAHSLGTVAKSVTRTARSAQGVQVSALNRVAKIGGDEVRIAIELITAQDRLLHEFYFRSVESAGEILQGRDPLISAGLPLASAIREAKAMYEPHSKPLPDDVITLLSPIIPEALLRKARYAVGDVKIAVPTFAFFGGTIVDEVIEMFGRRGIRPDAVTLDNIIVFRNEPNFEKQTDIILTAHELYHVRQYEMWGIDVFAYNYIKHHNGVEDEAEVAESFAASYITQLAAGTKRIYPQVTPRYTPVAPVIVPTPLGQSAIMATYSSGVSWDEQSSHAYSCVISTQEGNRPGYITADNRLISPWRNNEVTGEKRKAERPDMCSYDIYFSRTNETACVDSNGHIKIDKQFIGSCIPCSGDC